jgi:hypothetical protein
VALGGAIKEPQDKTRQFFVDESGDPAFYGKGGRIIVGEEGCSRTFLLGFVVTDDPEPLRERLVVLRDEIAKDQYLRSIPSFSKSLLGFHAKDDCPEIRMMVFKTLAEMDFSAQVIVARKIEPMFRAKYQGNQDRFYDDLVTRLFKNQLHMATSNIITFSRRGKKRRQYALRAALEKGIHQFSERWNHQVLTHLEVLTDQPNDEPMLQVVDYVNWAVQRAYHRGEMRYFEFLREKYSLVLDVFDKTKYRNGGNYYVRKTNPFDIRKASPLD